MKTLQAFVAFLMMFVLLSGSAAQAQDRKGWSGKAKGAAIGGGAGAVTGAVVGGGKGAVIGGVVGAVGGGLIGRKRDKKRDPARYNQYRNRK